VRQVGHLPELYKDAWSEKKILAFVLTQYGTPQKSLQEQLVLNQKFIMLDYTVTLQD
jgi:hypothetical protein